MSALAGRSGHLTGVFAYASIKRVYLLRVLSRNLARPWLNLAILSGRYQVEAAVSGVPLLSTREACDFPGEE